LYSITNTDLKLFGENKNGNFEKDKIKIIVLLSRLIEATPKIEEKQQIFNIFARFPVPEILPILKPLIFNCSDSAISSLENLYRNYENSNPQEKKNFEGLFKVATSTPKIPELQKIGNFIKNGDFWKAIFQRYRKMANSELKFKVALKANRFYENDKSQQKNEQMFIETIRIAIRLGKNGFAIALLSKHYKNSFFELTKLFLESVSKSDSFEILEIESWGRAQNAITRILEKMARTEPIENFTTRIEINKNTKNMVQTFGPYGALIYNSVLSNNKLQ
ncbi:hypothetical protein MHBO_004054, partial [Bonamia ostreae]